MIFKSYCISSHLNPLCSAINRKVTGFKFVYQSADQGQMRRKVGWSNEVEYLAVPNSDVTQKELETCDVLVTGTREMELFEMRVQQGLPTFYMSERWLKPRRLPGIVKLLHPGYFNMVRRLVRLMDSGKFWLLPIGIYAARDFVRMYWIFHGKWRYVFKDAEVYIERILGGHVIGFPQIKLWSYFVEAGCPVNNVRNVKNLKLLWVGRMIRCKHVETIITAFRQMTGASLLLVGDGTERTRLEELAGDLKVKTDDPLWHDGRIVFTPFQMNAKVRQLMREADVFVMASDAIEGWGAVVSEALSEGCRVVSSREVGSAATLLPAGCLYDAKDPEGLMLAVKYAMTHDVKVDMSSWSGERACDIILQILEGGK